MKPVDNWQRILLHSFSMHMTYWGLAALLVAFAGALFGRHVFHPTGLLFLSAVLLALTIPGRVVQQDLGNGRRRPKLWRSILISGLITAGVYSAGVAVARADQPLQLAMASPVVQLEIGQGQGGPSWEEVAIHAVPLVARWEGLRTRAYLDTIASPPVWTICYGETEGVRPGEVRTEAECQRGLETGLERYWQGWNTALTEEAFETHLTPRRAAAFTSLSWNIGIAGTRRSTAVARLNRGNIPGACEALTWWNRAGGMIIRGLVDRRWDEHGDCIHGYEGAA